MKTEKDILIESLNSYIDSLKIELEQYHKIIDRFIESPANKHITEEDISEAYIDWAEEHSGSSAAFKAGVNWAIGRMKSTGIEKQEKI